MSCAPVLPPLPRLAPPTSPEDEIRAMREELNLLRRRDETLKFYMHRLDEELRLAARLQQDFLPRRLPEVGPVRFHSLFRPAGYVSGDLFDVMRLDEHHVGFYLADAAGHGMPAALLAMYMKRALVTKQIPPGGGYRLLDPSETLALLNEALLEPSFSQSTFATALYGLIDSRTLQVRFARAGHPHPILLGPEGDIEPLSSEGSLLGVFAEATFPAQSATLRPGDRLLMFTDGIEVAFSTGPMDMHRWRQELYHRRTLPTEQLLTDFAESLDHETGSLQPKDDLTMVVLEVAPTAD